MECKLERVPKNIIACCVLHNLTVCNNVELEMLLTEIDSEMNESDIHDARSMSDLPKGKQKRDRIVELLLQSND